MDLKNTIKDDKDKVHVALDVFFYQEDDIVIGTVPALKISTWGETLEDAQRAINEVIPEWIQSVSESGLMHETLLRLGWTLVKGSATPPEEEVSVDSLNKYLASEKRDLALQLA